VREGRKRESLGSGVRQGDPLSPILFCLAEDALSRSLLAARSNGLIKDISVPRGCVAPSHALYADDMFLFCRGDSASLRCFPTAYETT